MKKITYLLFIIIIYSCSKTELIDYSGSEGIYFYVQKAPVSGYGDSTVWSANASTLIEFTKIPAIDTTLRLRVKITGEIKSYDRPLKVLVNKDSTTALEGINYVINTENLIVKAGMHYCDVPVIIKRAGNLQKETLRLTIELVSNEHFKLAFEKLFTLPGTMAMNPLDEGHNPSIHRVYMNYYLVRPSEWIPKIDYATGSAELGLLGQFSEKKFDLIAQVCTVTYDEFTSPSTMPNIRVQVINQQMKAYLINKYNEGTPVLENDGRLMWVMGVPWTSYIGVPYIFSK